MTGGMQVASLTAPIDVIIPTEKIEAFKKQLKEIAKTLQYINGQMEEVGKSVKKTFKETSKHLKVSSTTINKFHDGQKEVTEEGKKNESGAKRTAKVYGEWADKIAQARVAVGLLKFAVGAVIKLMAVPSGAFGAFVFLAERINKATSEMSYLSEATGFSLNTMRAMTLEAKALGFNFEHVNSIAEELNNKLGGEAGGFVEGQLREGLSAIGLEVEKIQRLKPEQQLEAIMNSGRDLMKKGRFTEFASAVDKIFGLEANRLLTAFQQKMGKSNQTWDEFLGKSKNFVTLSKEAEEGSRIFSSAMDKMKTSFSTLVAEFFGKMGKKLEPFFDSFMAVFENMSDTFSEVFAELLPKAVDVFMDGMSRLVNLLAELKENPEVVASAFESLIIVLKNMYRFGLSLSKVLIALTSVLTPILEIVNKILSLPFADKLIQVTAILAVIVPIALKLASAVMWLFTAFGFMSTSVAGATTAFGTLVVGGTGLGAMFSYLAGTMGVAVTGAGALSLGVAGVLASVAGLVGYLTGLGADWLSELIFGKGNSITDKLADLMNFFSGDIQRENMIQLGAQQATTQALAKRRENMERLASGGPNTTNSNTNASVNDNRNQVINVDVRDAETGRAVLKEIKFRKANL